MKWNFRKFDNKFAPNWKNYIFQPLLATVSVFLIILSLSIDDDAVIIASIGATSFIVFALPKSVSASPRNVIGGHFVGLVCGLLVSLIPEISIVHQAVLTSLVYSLAVGSCIFVMVITNTEHAPAAGTALGVAINGLSLNVIITIAAGTIILALIHTLFKDKLKDLT